MIKIVVISLLIISLLPASPVFAWDDNMIAKDRETLRDWDNMLELECFLALYDEPLIIMSGEPFNGQCENMAFQVRNKAREWGRFLDVEILTKAEYFKYYRKPGQPHAINKAVIGNEFWFVDQRANKVWFAYYLD